MKRDVSLVRLSRDHQRGLALSKHIENVFAGVEETSLPELRREVLDFWQEGLLPHFRAECECLLARLARYAAPEDELLTRTERDHVQIHALVTALKDSDDEATHRELIAEAGELLKQHIRWEEAVLFEATQRLLGEADLGKLGDDIAERIPEIPPVPSWFPRAQDRR